MSNKKIFRSEDSRFYIKTGLKFVLACLISMLLVSYVFWLLIQNNHLFFVSHGYANSEVFKEAYYNLSLKFIVDSGIGILIFLVLNFLCGMYAAHILLRPFQSLSIGVQDLKEKSSATSDVMFFSDFKSLRWISHIFYQFCEESFDTGAVAKRPKIPEHLLRIRDISYDRNFTINFALFIGAISLAAISFLVIFIGTVEESTMELALKNIVTKNSRPFEFLRAQERLYYSTIVFAFLVVLGSYGLLAIHLYSKVSGAAQGFFLTIRAFIKGNYTARVHLIGYTYIREHGRVLNKFLDHFCREMKIDLKDKKMNREKSNKRKS